MPSGSNAVGHAEDINRGISRVRRKKAGDLSPRPLTLLLRGLLARRALSFFLAARAAFTVGTTHNLPASRPLISLTH